MRISHLPPFAVLPSEHVPPGTVVVCEAEMACGPDQDWTHLVTGEEWSPSGKLVALASCADLCGRYDWVHAVAAGMRSQFFVHREAGERFAHIEWSEGHPPA